MSRRGRGRGVCRREGFEIERTDYMAIQRGYYSTYQDWLEVKRRNGIVRVELINGEIYMFAAPNRRHQGVVGELLRQLSNHLRGKTCKTYTGPIAVRLEKDTVVEPDIIVVCDPNKLTKSGVEGAPDLIIEILSPSTIKHDTYVKFTLYRRNRVPEYWIIDPEENFLTVHRLAKDEYVTNVYGETDTATVSALPGFEMDLSAVLAAEEAEAEE